MTLKQIHPDDLEFVNSRIAFLPNAFKANVLSEHKRNLSRLSRREANLALIELTESADASITHRLNRGNLNFDEIDLKSASKSKARRALHIWLRLKENAIEIPYKEIVAFIRDNGIEPHSLKADPTEMDMHSLIRKANNPQWWGRQLRRVQNRDTEITARSLNLVSKPKQIYVSDLNYRRFQRQRIEQRKYLENMIAENEDGDQFRLSELQDSSISNPYIKKSELMVRCRGFEDYAKQLEHEGLFITITCPSKYHRAFGISGDANPKWDGATVLDAQTYLKTVWARIRASLDREGIRVYGFRVAEPHHDGTPHWHLLLFVATENKTVLKETFERYAFEEDGDEKGAAESRLKIVEIDPTKGSATGYIAKYISKNINGEGLEQGIYGENPILAAEKVTAWATIWGIRQFQQIGGAPVSVYRELRRLQPSDDNAPLFEEARAAADNSDWQGYQIAMGGVNTALNDRPISMVYWTEVNTQTGEIAANQYGDLKAPSIYGLEFNGTLFNTRPHLWKISRA